METTDSMLIGANTEKQVGSTESPEQGNVIQDCYPSNEVPLSNQTALASIDRFASDYSDYSVDVNRPDGLSSVSHVATYKVSLPPQRLDLYSSISGEVLKQEIESVYTTGLLLFTEVSHYLQKIESRFATFDLALNGSSKGFADIQAMLEVERAEFEENFKNTGIKSEKASNSVRKLLSLNRIRWDILLEACVWDQRLQMLLTSTSHGLVQKKVDSREIGKPGGDAEGSQTHTGKAAGNTGMDDLGFGRVADVEQSSEEFSLEKIVQKDEEQDYEEQNCKSLPTEEDIGQMPTLKETNDVSVQEHPESSVTFGSHSGIENLHIDEKLSSGNVMENKATSVAEGLESAGKGTVAARFLTKEDPRGWAWRLFSEIREECMKDIHKGYLPKFGYLPNPVTLHSPEFLPTLSRVIMEEGSRLHLPVSDGDYIVSDYDGEISSVISCALSVMKDLAHSVSDGDNVASLKLAESEPSPNWMGSGYDPGQLHHEVTLGVEKYPAKGKYFVVIMHASQFRALREKCCPSEVDYIASLCRCEIWDAEGGRRNSFYAKTLDERLLIKEIKKSELDSFMKIAAVYFRYLNDSFETGNQTCLAKILGIYQITIRHPKSGKVKKLDLMVQENQFFGRNIDRQYDLKGAFDTRFKAAADDSIGDALSDQNFVDDMNSSPLYIGEKCRRLLQRAIWNDTSFLNSINVMDYSLLVGVDEQRYELVCGISDYLRQYTWDKQLETWVKSTLMPKNVLPTIISPKDYKKRFRKFVDTHFRTALDNSEPQ